MTNVFENEVQHWVGSGNEGAFGIRRVMDKVSDLGCDDVIIIKMVKMKQTDITNPFIITQNEARRPNRHGSS